MGHLVWFVCWCSCDCTHLPPCLDDSPGWATYHTYYPTPAHLPTPHGSLPPALHTCLPLTTLLPLHYRTPAPALHTCIPREEEAENAPVGRGKNATTFLVQHDLPPLHGGFNLQLVGVELSRPLRARLAGATARAPHTYTAHYAPRPAADSW